MEVVNGTDRCKISLGHQLFFCGLKKKNDNKFSLGLKWFIKRPKCCFLKQHLFSKNLSWGIGWTFKKTTCSLGQKKGIREEKKIYTYSSMNFLLAPPGAPQALLADLEFRVVLCVSLKYWYSIFFGTRLRQGCIWISYPTACDLINIRFYMS